MKSKAGRRTIGLPAPLVAILRAHVHVRKQERMAAGPAWAESFQGSQLLFTTPDGGPVDPDNFGHRWHDVLNAADVRRVRLHDARHTAATALLLQKVPERVVMDVMGWSSTKMRERYQHVVPELRRAAAEAVGAHFWPEGTATGNATGGGSLR